MRWRALLIAGLVATLFPAAADARPRTVNVGRGEIVIVYSGLGTSSHSNGAVCQGTDPCVAFGELSFTTNWDATVIADRRGRFAGDDTTLSARALEHYQPDVGNPTPPAQPVDCTSSMRDKNGEYAGGASVTATAKSIGVQLFLPADSRWLELQNTSDPAHCGWGENVTAGAFLGGQSYGPGDDESAAQKRLARAVAPQLAIRKSDKTVTKHFNFVYHEAPPKTVGPYSQTIINIESTVTLVNGCRRFDETHARCTDYYR